MANEKFIALEETSQEIKTTVNDVKTNVDGLKNTDVPGIDETVNATYEKTLELERKIGGTGGAFFIYSDMSVKNEQPRNELFKFDWYNSDYSYTGFEKGNDAYLLGVYVPSSTQFIIKLYKISDYKTNPVSALIINSSTDFTAGGSSSSYISICSNHKDAFYILTANKVVLKVSVIEQTITTILSGLSFSTYAKAIAVNDDETICAYVSSGYSYIYVYNIITGAQICRISNTLGDRDVFWFENGYLKYLSNSNPVSLKTYNCETGERIGSVTISSSSVSASGISETKDCVYYYYYTSGSSGERKLAVFDKRSLALYEMSYAGTIGINSARFVVLRDLENGKMIYLYNGYIYTTNAYRTGEICLYLKTGKKVYTDGLVRDVNNEYIPYTDEVVTIPKDSKYLIHNYSYITVG